MGSPIEDIEEACRSGVVLRVPRRGRNSRGASCRGRMVGDDTVNLWRGMSKAGSKSSNACRREWDA